MICRVCASSGPNGSSISRIFGSRISTCASADALALAARQHVRIAVAERAEPDRAEPGLRALARLRTRRALDLEPDGDVVDRGFPGKQRIGLEQIAGVAG